MIDITRPEYGMVWASEGEKLSPTQDKIELGWVQEMMPFQWENFLQARQDEAITYLLQKGIPEYSATQEYIAQKSVVLYQGAVYLATQTVTNVLPSVATSWKRVSTISDASGIVSVAGGGTGATTAAQARTNLGLGTASTLNTDAVVQKDENGNFSAGVITASLAGNAASADKLKTARTLQVAGVLTSTPTPFDGTSNVSIPVTSVSASAIVGTVPTESLTNTVIKTSATGVAKLPKGLTSQRPPNPEFGDFRGNETTGLLEYWNGFNWVSPSQYAADLVVMKSGSTMSGDLTLPSLNSGQLAGMRNKIINGDFSVNQYTAPYYVVNTPKNMAFYSVDRWLGQIYAGEAGGGSSTCTATRMLFTPGQSNVPGEPEAYMRLRVATVGTPAAGACIRVRQGIEGVRALAGKKATLSFYAKADASRACAVIIGQSFGAGGSENAGVGQVINLTTSWAKYSITLDVPAINGKTIGVGSALFASIYLYKHDNTLDNDGLGRVGAWVTGQYIDLALVQLEEGSVATPFENRHQGLELLLCQRYYRTSGYEAAYAATDDTTKFHFPVQMRASPTAVKIGSEYGNSSAITEFDGVRLTAVGGRNFYNAYTFFADF